jgi:hypothetical protein
VVLRVRGSTGSLGKLTLQRDCGVSWRYQAISLKTPVNERSRDRRTSKPLRFVRHIADAIPKSANMEERTQVSG